MEVFVIMDFTFLTTTLIFYICFKAIKVKITAIICLLAGVESINQNPIKAI